MIVLMDKPASPKKPVMTVAMRAEVALNSLNNPNGYVMFEVKLVVSDDPYVLLARRYSALEKSLISGQLFSIHTPQIFTYGPIHGNRIDSYDIEFVREINELIFK